MSVRMVGQVTLVEGGDADARRAVVQCLTECATSIEGVTLSHAGVHSETSVGGGDVSWDLLFGADDAVEAFCERARSSGREGLWASMGVEFARLAGQVANIELAIPETIEGENGAVGLVGVKRTLWLRVLPEAPADAVERFERETPLLATAIPAIRNWRWSRVRTRQPTPMEGRWTHLWEQEFETFEGLETDYMSSPFHWGHIDRWFDPEMPDQIVDVWLAHLAYPATAPVLSWESDR